MAMTRAKLQLSVKKTLKGIDFPAERVDLLYFAQDMGAGDEVVLLLNDLPEGEYESMADVMDVMTELMEEYTLSSYQLA